MSSLSASAGRLEIPPGPPETFFVLDERESELVGEVERAATHAVQLALPARTYRLKRRAGAQFYAQTITIERGETTRVVPDAMEPVQLSRDVARGGLFREAERHAVSVGVEYASAVLEGQALGLRGRVGFVSAFADMGELEVSLSYGGTPVVDGSVSSTVHRLGIECAMLARIPLEPLYVGVGGALEGVVWIQVLESEMRTVAGLRYSALLTLELGLGDGWALWARGQLGAELVPASTQLRHELNGSGTVGARYHFAL